MISTEIYAAALDAVQVQNLSIYGAAFKGGPWTGAARQSRLDPCRKLDLNVHVIATYVQSDDVVVDVGGGAGRVGLPLSLRCGEVLNIAPSTGIGEEFQSLAREASITNVQLISSESLDAKEVIGDVAIISDVTYFVRDIAEFIHRL